MGKYWLRFLLILGLLFVVVSCAGENENVTDHDTTDDDAANDDTTDDDDDDDVNDDDTSSAVFQVGAARVDITPDWPVKMGGYGLFFFSEDWCRWSEGVRDPIYATAIAIEEGDGEPIIQIALDTIGIITTDVVVIQAGVAAQLGISPDRVVVAATHNHGSPDTIGIWGVLWPPITGRDEAFIDYLERGAIAAAVEAYQYRRPAIARVAKGDEPNYHFNSQEVVDPRAKLDSTMTMVSFTEPSGAPIATLMNWPCHPMVLPEDNRLITADFPGVYYRLMDEEVGGVNMFVNGSLGAAVHPYNRFEHRIAEGEDDMEFMGRGLADTAQALLAQARELPSTGLKLTVHEVRGQLQNPIFSLFGQLGLIPRDIPGFMEWGTTTMSVYRVGPVVFGTVPGELVPDLGLELREIMGGEHQIVENIGQDWLGYMMTARQYFSIFYIYFSILSIGPNVGDLLLAAYQEVFDGGF